MPGIWSASSSAYKLTREPSRLSTARIDSLKCTYHCKAESKQVRYGTEGGAREPERARGPDGPGSPLSAFFVSPSSCYANLTCQNGFQRIGKGSKYRRLLLGLPELCTFWWGTSFPDTRPCRLQRAQHRQQGRPHVLRASKRPTCSKREVGEGGQTSEANSLFPPLQRPSLFFPGFPRCPHRSRPPSRKIG